MVSALVLLMAAPLWLLIVLALKLDSRGSLLYRQERVGMDGHVFLLYKFRSMVAGAEERLEELKSQNEMSGPVFKMAKDPRVTKFGRILRKTSLDEFPQLQTKIEYN